MGLAGSPQTMRGATTGFSSEDSTLRRMLVICSHQRANKKDEQDRLKTMEGNFSLEKTRPRVTAIFKHLVATCLGGVALLHESKGRTRDEGW